MPYGHQRILQRNILQTPVYLSSGSSPCQTSPCQLSRSVTGRAGPIRESAEEVERFGCKFPNPNCHDYKELRFLNFAWQLIPTPLSSWCFDICAVPSSCFWSVFSVWLQLPFCKVQLLLGSNEGIYPDLEKCLAESTCLTNGICLIFPV